MPIVSITRASGVLTLTGLFVNTQTVTIGGKVYTTQTSLTDVDGNVLIGGDAEACIDNLVAAINLAAGAGTLYAASMTANPYVYARKLSASTMGVYCKIGGLIGNFVDTTETQTNASWGGATLGSGAGSVADVVDLIRDKAQVNSEVLQALDKIDPTDP